MAARARVGQNLEARAQRRAYSTCWVSTDLTRNHAFIASTHTTQRTDHVRKILVFSADRQVINRSDAKKPPKHRPNSRNFSRKTIERRGRRRNRHLRRRRDQHPSSRRVQHLRQLPSLLLRRLQRRLLRLQRRLLSLLLSPRRRRIPSSLRPPIEVKTRRKWRRRRKRKRRTIRRRA